MYEPVDLEASKQQQEHFNSLASSSSSLSSFSSSSSSSSSSSVKRVLIILSLAVVGLTVGLLLFRFVKSDDFGLFVHWLQTHEVLGAALYVICFTSFIVLCFPSTVFELLAGYIFGFWLGLLLATVGKLVGSVLSRQVHAYMARGHPALQGFQSLLRRRQVLVVFLTRVAFFPIAVKNYGLSVLDVTFRVYFAAALLTGLPFSAIWVYSGHAVENFTTLLASPTASRHSTEMVLLLVGAGSALLLLGVVGLYTRKYVLGLAEEEKKIGLAAATLDTPHSTDEDTSFTATTTVIRREQSSC
ncbi:hypothetical protein KXD40_002764 [Peronospora effusa]|nr:hypothetical protein KXD40_002764 [Peronospora effusa]